MSATMVGTHIGPHSLDKLGPCSQVCGGPALRQVVEEAPGEMVKVYPNPNNGSFTIELSFIEEGAAVVVTDMQGKVVGERKFTAEDGNQVRLELNVAPGMYFVRVVNGEHRHQTKVVVQ